MKKYIVELTAEQREELLHMISMGKAAARELTHARILLKADQGPEGPAWSDGRIQEALEVGVSTVKGVRKICASMAYKKRSSHKRSAAHDDAAWTEPRKPI